jgi:RHS repeat-associated protein
VPWRENDFIPFYTDPTSVALQTWYGSLVDKMTDASGMMYMRNRYYNPQTGAFTQEDPIGLAGGVNLYGFAGGDPVNYADPYGLDPCQSSSAWTDCLAVALANWGGRHQNIVALYTGAVASSILEASGLNAAATAGDDIGNGRVLEGGAHAAILIGGGVVASKLGAFASRALTRLGGARFAQMSGMLRAAAAGKGNFGIGSATVEEAEALGRAWVGEGYTMTRDGIVVSRDGLRQYRPASYKPKLGGHQANLEAREVAGGRWQHNAHIDITP